MIIVQQQLEAIHAGIAEMGIQAPYLSKNVAQKLGRSIKTKSKQAIKTLVTKHSGAMYAGAFNYWSPSKKQEVITNNATSDTSGARYPWVLAHGKRLDPRSGKTLTFAPVDFVEGPGNRYLNSSQEEDDVQKVIDSFMRGLEKKGILKYE